MCFTPDPPELAETPPPEVLEQEAPEKKAANQKKASTLAIGTKRYRNESGLGTSGSEQRVKPIGPSVSI